MLIVDFQLLSLTYWGIDFLDLNHQIRLEWIDLVLRIVALLSHGDVRYHAVRVRWLPRKGCPIVQLTSHSMPWIQSLWMNLDGSKITMLGILVLANHLCQYICSLCLNDSLQIIPPAFLPIQSHLCVCQEKFIPPEPQLSPKVATASPAAKTLVIAMFRCAEGMSSKYHDVEPRHWKICFHCGTWRPDKHGNTRRTDGMAFIMYYTTILGRM